MRPHVCKCPRRRTHVWKTRTNGTLVVGLGCGCWSSSDTVLHLASLVWSWRIAGPIPFTLLFVHYPIARRWSARSVPGAHMLRWGQADRNDCGLQRYHSVPVETGPHYVWEWAITYLHWGKPSHSSRPSGIWGRVAHGPGADLVLIERVGEWDEECWCDMESGTARGSSGQVYSSWLRGRQVI